MYNKCSRYITCVEITIIPSSMNKYADNDKNSDNNYDRRNNGH